MIKNRSPLEFIAATTQHRERIISWDYEAIGIDYRISCIAQEKSKIFDREVIGNFALVLYQLRISRSHQILFKCVSKK